MAKSKDGLQQQIIDAGQKRIGTQQCTSCRFVYQPGDLDDEKLHDAEHKKFSGVISFPGWKAEQKVVEDVFSGWKIVRVKATAPARHWEKVKGVLEVVDDILGIHHGLRQPEASEAFLYVQEKRVVGLVLAERILPTDKVSKCYMKDDLRVVSEEPAVESEDEVKRLVGVSRIWVHQDFQRKKIATKLTEALRVHYRLPTTVKKKDLVFSHTSDMGSAFVSKYMGSSEYLVYRPTN